MTVFNEGDRVRVVSTGRGFYSFNLGRSGTIVRVDEGDSDLPLRVAFEEGNGYDWGHYSEVELLDAEKESPKTIKQAIEDVESALAALKALVG